MPYPCIVAKSTVFACENHETPGSCSVECKALAEDMHWYGYVGQDHDPTGCRYYPEPPPEEFRLRNGGVFVTYFEMEGA